MTSALAPMTGFLGQVRQAKEIRERTLAAMPSDHAARTALGAIGSARWWIDHADDPAAALTVVTRPTHQKTSGRLTQDRVAEIRAMAAQGLSAASIRRAVGCSIETVYRWAPDAPKRRSPKAISAPDADRVVRRYIDGESVESIASGLGASPGQVRALILRRGVRLRPKNTHGAIINKRNRNRRALALRTEIEAMWRLGSTDTKIGRALGVSWSTIRNYRKTLGLPNNHGSTFVAVKNQAVALKRAGATHREIAAQLGIPRGTVGNWMVRLGLSTPNARTTGENR